MNLIVSALARLAITAMALGATAAQAAEVKLIASAAMKEILGELLPLFEKATGHAVKATWSGTEAATKRLREGETFDVVLIAGANIDRLMTEGRIVAGSRADVARSGIGVAVRAGLPKPDISSGEAVKKAVLAAKTVAYSSGPSGFYLADLFKRWGISGEIQSKVIQTPSGVQVGEVVARGEAELGFQQVSELMHVKGIDYLGPLPPEIQHVTLFSAGLHATAAAPAAAEALVKFLTRPEAAPILRAAGMEPG